jgi:diguanylate cyclase (GGDEF)-like protein
MGRAMAIGSDLSAHNADDRNPEIDRLVAARDRAAAALDRVEARLARVRAEAHLGESLRDSLTGAMHRDSGRQLLVEEVVRAHRMTSPLAVAFLDVVGLKRTNDTYGHATGDLVLAAVGATLVAGLRGYDIVVRYGGDEFVCGLPDTSLQEAEQRLCEVTGGLSTARRTIQLTVGVAELESGESLDDLVQRADHAMYEQRRRAAASGPRAVP